MASIERKSWVLGENIFVCAVQLTLGLNERIHSIEMPAAKLYLQMPAAVLEILLENYN